MADVGERSRPAEEIALRLVAGLAVEEERCSSFSTPSASTGMSRLRPSRAPRSRSRRLLLRSDLVDEAVVDLELVEGNACR